MESDSLLNFVSDAIARVPQHSAHLIFAALAFGIPEFHFLHSVIQHQLFFLFLVENHFLFSAANI
jgi:hypothetical protein